MMKLKIGGYQGAQSVHTKALIAFIDKLLEIDPRFQIDQQFDVTADGIAAQDLFAGVESGAFDMCYMASGYMTERVNELGLLDVPFLVDDREKIVAALHAGAGEILKSAFEQKTEMKLLGFWDNGMRHLTNSKRPILGPADCRGLSIRTLNNRFYQNTLQCMGLTPVVTDVKELVAAVESGEVDGQENPLTNLVRFGMHKFQPHISETGHINGVALFVMNANAFVSLDGQAQEAVMNASSYATQYQWQVSSEEDLEARDILKLESIEIVPRSEIDIASFKIATKRVMDQIYVGIPNEVVGEFISAIK
ncbi:MAG: TRAP transporter substrate-binding protein [Pseudomonadota bacterium]